MRWIAGLLLLCAAVLKAAGLLDEPTAALLHPLGGVCVAIQIGVELAVGLLILSGAYWSTLRWFVELLFSGFSAYSLYLAVNGAASCGYFGPVDIDSWWTFLLDLAVVLGLIVSSVRSEREMSVAGEPEVGRHIRLSTVSPKVVAGVMAVLIIITTSLLARTLNRQNAVAHGVSTMADGLVIFEPEQWVEQKLPIAEFVDVDLSRGEWIAALHRHDCSECQDALPLNEQRASMGQRVALIEIPLNGPSPSFGSACHTYRLTDDRQWFVQAPVEIQMRDGIVMAAKVHDH